MLSKTQREAVGMLIFAAEFIAAAIIVFSPFWLTWGYYIITGEYVQ